MTKTNPKVFPENIVLVLILIGLFFVRCNKQEEDLNMPPSSIIINEIILSKSPNVATISWQESIDPEQDEVNYQIEFYIYNMESSDYEKIGSYNSSETTYSFNNLDVLKKYRVEIFASDDIGNKSETISFEIEYPRNSIPPSKVDNIEYFHDKANNSITISWESAIDTGGDEISYELDIYIYPEDNTNNPEVFIVKELVTSELEYTFNTNESRDYYLNITALDVYGNRSTQTRKLLFIIPTGIWEGDLNFVSQEDVDRFIGHDIQIINGNIIIREPHVTFRHVVTPITEPIVDLSPLEGIKTINGDVFLNSYGYHRFENLSAFGEVTSIQGTLEITQTPGNISDYYQHQPNFVKNLEGLSNLSTLGGLVIDNHRSLETIQSLNSLSEVKEGGIRISYNENLSVISGFQNLLSIEGDLRLSNNPSLHSVNAFNNLNFVANDLTILETKLKNLDFLANLSEVKGLKLVSNPDLLDGNLLNLITLSNLSVIENNSLESVHITQGNIQSNKPVSIRISDNPNLNTVTGFEDVLTFTEIDIRNNPKFTSLNGFNNVVTIQNYLRIANNDILNNLDALSNLSLIECGDPVYNSNGEIEGNLVITGNFNLTNFCGLTNIFVVNGLCSLEYLISQNAFNPTNQDFLNGNCNN